MPLQVDWYPWGEEAFARARAEDKPIFLSVGYATCHWCVGGPHVSTWDSWGTTNREAEALPHVAGGYWGLAGEDIVVELHAPRCVTEVGA